MCSAVSDNATSDRRVTCLRVGTKPYKIKRVFMEGLALAVKLKTKENCDIDDEA